MFVNEDIPLITLLSVGSVLTLAPLCLYNRCLSGVTLSVTERQFQSSESWRLMTVSRAVGMTEGHAADLLERNEMTASEEVNTMGVVADDLLC